MKAIKTIALIVILSVLLVVVAVANQLTPSRPVAAAVEPAVAVVPTPMLAPAPVPTLVDYEAMTTRVLRPMARDKKIPHWKKLTKAELIAALREV